MVGPLPASTRLRNPTPERSWPASRPGFVMNFQHKYNDTEMARILGISRKTLWEKRKKWDIVRKS